MTEYLQLRSFEKALNADVVKKALGRNTTPPWVKSHCGQLEDPDYLGLTLAERGLLHDLRLLAARRGNKIAVDEKILRRQLGYSTRTALVQKLSTLRAARFLEAYNEATNTAAKDLFPSHLFLDDSEIDSRLEVEVEVEVDKDLSSRPKANSGDTANGTQPTTEGVTPKVTAWIRTIGVLYPDDQVVADELRKAFKLQDTDQAVELWRELRAGLGTGAA